MKYNFPPRMRLAALLLAFFLPGTVLAHSDEQLDAAASPHGGQARMAGPFHFELVVEGKELAVYVTDHGGNKVQTGGAAGTATLTMQKMKEVVTLTPAGDNLLKGSGTIEVGTGVKIVVKLKLSGQAPQQASFTPLVKPRAAEKPQEAGHAHH